MQTNFETEENLARDRSVSCPAPGPGHGFLSTSQVESAC